MRKISSVHWFVRLVEDWFFWPSLLLTAGGFFAFVIGLPYSVDSVGELGIFLGGLIGSLGFFALGCIGLGFWLLVQVTNYLKQ